MRHGIARIVVLAAIVAGCLAGLAGTASAAFIHSEANYLFGEDGTSGSDFTSPDALAFNQANDRLYVLQGSPRRIHGFHLNSPGSLSTLGGSFPLNVNSGAGDPDIGVDNTALSTANNIYYVQDGDPLVGFTAGGAAGPVFTPPSGEKCGVAIAPDGHVWISSYGGQKYEEYLPTGGGPVGSVSVSAQGSPCHITFDRGNGDLYASLYSGAGTVRYTKASGYAPESATVIDTATNSKLTVNTAKDVLYVGRSDGTVRAYDTETASLLETFGAGGPGIRGVAVDETTDTVFVSRGSKIEEWRGVLVPKATTGEPSGNSTVTGEADPDGAGAVTECFFEYGDGFASQAPCDQALPIAGPTPVTATLSGLLGEQENPYRLVVGNSNGKYRGPTRTITPHNVTGLKTDPALNVSRTGADLHGSFEGDGTETFFYFEWGQTTDYGSQSALPPGVSAGEPTAPPATNVGFTPVGLKPDTTYHFHVVGKNPKGISPGQDLTFKTLPSIQSLVTEPASGVGGRFATLNASYVGDGQATNYYFEYGPTEAYGSKTPLTAAGTAGPTPLTAPLENLTLETTYHYRVVATNNLGTTKGADQSFTTENAVKGLLTLPATGISLDGVTLNAEYLGNGEATDFWFEYGLTTAYGMESEVASAGEPTGTTPLTLDIDQFEGFSTYHYRVVAENSEGKTFGNDLTFETPDALLPEISATTGAAVGPNEGQVAAQIKPNRWSTVYRIQYGTDTEYGSFTPLSEPIGSDLVNHPVSTTVPGLAPGTTYHLRVIAINFVGTARGSDITLTTPDAPEIESAAVSSVGQTTAHLSALVAGNSSPTTVRFDYGTGTSYGSSTAPIASGSSLLGTAVDADLTGLAPGTAYHVRAVAINAIGTTNGIDISFTTQAAAAEPPPPTKPKKCKKGFVKKKGKCVKKKSKRKRNRH